MVKGPTGCGLQGEDINGKGSNWLWSTGGEDINGKGSNWLWSTRGGYKWQRVQLAVVYKGRV